MPNRTERPASRAALRARRIAVRAVGALAAMSATVSAQTVTPDSVLVIEAGTERIEPHRYAGRGDIRRVEFAEPCRVSEVGEYAFWDCPALEEVEFPATVRTIGEGALKECFALRRVALPRGLKAVPKYLCAWDTLLRDVPLPPRVTDIGSHAFAYCASLRRMELPQTLRHVGSNVWSRCSALVEMEFPDSVTELESYALSDCTSLRRVKLPANPSMLGELITSGCTSLAEVTELSPQPPPFDCGSPLFEPDDAEAWSRCRLRVRPGLEKAYAEAPGWNRFF